MKTKHTLLTCLVFAVVLPLTGCKTNPPTVPIVELGKIVVRANVDSAAIYLDDNNTGRFTPDTVETTVGQHVVRIEKEGFVPRSEVIRVGKDSVSVYSLTMVLASESKVVLIEDFSNVSCIPCVPSNVILRQLADHTYGRSKLVAIKFATNFPGPNDPFYNANIPDCSARISYYNVLFAPTALVDGIERPTATDSIALKTSIDTRLALQPAFRITVSDSIAGASFAIVVRVQTLDTAGVDFSNLVLHTVVTETDITFSSPPGSNGETEFHDVMRVMLPSHAGEALAQGNRQPGIVKYDRQVMLNFAWNSANLHTIAFIQNTQTREVLQTGSTF